MFTLVPGALSLSIVNVLLVGRSGAEGDVRDFEAGGVKTNGSPQSNLPTPLDSPVEGGGNKGMSAVARGYGSEDGGLLPLGPPAMERNNSSSSLMGLVSLPVSWRLVLGWG